MRILTLFSVNSVMGLVHFPVSLHCRFYIYIFPPPPLEPGLGYLYQEKILKEIKSSLTKAAVDLVPPYKTRVAFSRYFLIM